MGLKVSPNLWVRTLNGLPYHYAMYRTKAKSELAKAGMLTTLPAFEKMLEAQ